MLMLEQSELLSKIPPRPVTVAQPDMIESHAPQLTWQSTVFPICLL